MSETTNANPAARIGSSKRLVVACVCAGLAVVTGTTVGAVAFARQRAELQRVSRILNDFCITSRTELRSVIRDLESPEPRIRSIGLRNFYSGTYMFTNKWSFDMCLDNVPAMPVDCGAAGDVACRLRLAYEIQNALSRRYPGALSYAVQPAEAGGN